MQLHNGKPDLPGRTLWWALVRNKLMAVISSFRPELRDASYRAERHYMRGPGPKWRAKHGSLPTARSQVSAVQHGRLNSGV
jgi:hypothetical protein